MGWFHKIKKFLEWYEHGKAITEIGVFLFLSLGGGTLLRALLIQFTKIPAYWITPMWLVLTGTILWVCLRFAPHILEKRPAQPSSPSSPGGSLKNREAVSQEWSRYSYTKVSDGTFQNQEVLLDGKDFRRCRFVNATFIYNGEGPVMFGDDTVIGGTFNLHTNDPSVQITMRIMKMLQEIAEGAKASVGSYKPSGPKQQP